MKKPSIDAIRRFKEQQERKKLEETERKVQERLSILEHRAAQGDRKAKSELKIIEKAKEERIRQIEARGNDHDLVTNNRHTSNQRQSDRIQTSGNSKNVATSKPKRFSTDFDELMRLAATNNNQVRREEVKKPSPPPKRVPSIPKRHRDALSNPERLSTPPSRAPQCPVNEHPSTSRPVIKTQQVSQANRSQRQRPPIQQTLPNSVQMNPRSTTIMRSQHDRPTPARAPLIRPPLPARPVSASYARGYRDNYYDEDDDDEYEDDYEQDDFVVDEDDMETQDEVSKTIKSVFGYDKRRCDLREAELDRQYRQIGRVSTFEDLEREERRASRLAAVEDARALREEEDRKRLKKMRLKGQR